LLSSLAFVSFHDPWSNVHWGNVMYGIAERFRTSGASLVAVSVFLGACF